MKSKKLRKILNGLYSASEWISEVAESQGRRTDGTEIFESHIQDMLDAIDEAHDLLNK